MRCLCRVVFVFLLLAFVPARERQVEWEAFLADILARLRDEAVDLADQLQGDKVNLGDTD